LFFPAQLPEVFVSLQHNQNLLDYAEAKRKMEGKIEGKIEGIAEEKLKNAKNAKKIGLSIEQIQQITNLSKEEIEKIE